ncbi:MAG: hypothetical protein ACT4NU_09805 [Chromatiales bacterium]
MEALNPRNLKLFIPHLWDKDWAAAVAEAEKEEKFLVSIQERAAYLLKPISDFDVTFERLGWLNLWTKVFSLLEGARASILRNSKYLLEILNRIGFELFLQVYTITESNRKDRLRGYCAWCLWNDRDFVRELVDPKALDGIWDVSDVRDIVEDPLGREVYESLFGSLPEGMVADEREAKKGRLQQQDRGRHRLERIEAWLHDPDLGVWLEKLEQISDGHRSPSFFALFGQDEASIPKRLKSAGMRWSYGLYKKGSMFIHGSTLEHSLMIGNESITPAFLDTEESVNDLANHVGHICNHVLVGLCLLQQELWPRTNKVTD